MRKSFKCSGRKLYVFEDAPKGVEAAQNAGMKCVVLTTMHDKEELKNYENVLLFISDYTSIEPQNFEKIFSTKAVNKLFSGIFILRNKTFSQIKKK